MLSDSRGVISALVDYLGDDALPFALLYEEYGIIGVTQYDTHLVIFRESGPYVRVLRGNKSGVFTVIDHTGLIKRWTHNLDFIFAEIQTHGLF